MLESLIPTTRREKRRKRSQRQRNKSKGTPIEAERKKLHRKELFLSLDWYSFDSVSSSIPSSQGLHLLLSLNRCRCLSHESSLPTSFSVLQESFVRLRFVLSVSSSSLYYSILCMTLSFVAFPSLCKSLKSCRTRKTQTDITWHAGWWVHQKEEGHTQETVTDWCVMLDKIRRWEGQREENEEEDEKTKRMRQRIKSRTESLRNFFLFRPLLETQGKLASTLVIFEQNKRWNQSKWGFECFSKLAQLERRLSGWKKKIGRQL